MAGRRQRVVDGARVAETKLKPFVPDKHAGRELRRPRCNTNTNHDCRRPAAHSGKRFLVEIRRIAGVNKFESMVTTSPFATTSGARCAGPFARAIP